jgi:hypothetical protein
MVVVCSASADLQHARIITVDDDGPADFNTIQAAIDDSNDADTVLVADGTYWGPGNRGIDFLGKAITVRSENGPKNCIVDCWWQDRGFIFQSGEDPNSVLDGFTITRGESEVGYGGGIRLTISGPTIMNCVITNNIAPIVSGFPGSFATSGGGIYSELGSPLIINCVISDNIATGDGGGLYFYKGSPIIKNTNISTNIADDGGAIKCYANCLLTISNSIIWGNSAGAGLQISLERIDLLGGCPTVGISYTDLEGGFGEIHRDRCNSSYVIWGPGNIDADPCFIDPINDDYHLKSQGGRYDPNDGGWTTDDVTSPCVDAGDPMSPMGPEPFPNGGRINMGAYGGTAEASKSYFSTPPCEMIVAGDINGDCKIDFSDFRILALNWMWEE